MGEITILIQDKPDTDFLDILNRAVQDRWICAIDSRDTQGIKEEVDDFLISAERTNARYLTIMDKDKPVGMAMPRQVPRPLIKLYREATQISDTCGHPWIVYILPHYRGRGLSLRIIEHCKTMFDELLWFPDPSNHKSINLARRNGFRPVIVQRYSPVYHWSNKMKLLTQEQIQEIIERLKVTPIVDNKNIIDIFMRRWNAESYYATNTRGVIVHYPHFRIADIISGERQGELVRAIREVNLLDYLIVQFTSTEKWRNNPNINMGNLELQLTWLYEDMEDFPPDLNIGRLLRESSGYSLKVYDAINGKAQVYEPTPWV